MSSHIEGSSQTQAPQGSNNEGTKKRKGRGIAKKTPNWGKRQLIIDFDEDWNPCGGEHAQLATQLGVFVKNGKLFPLTKETWNDIDEAAKERIWTEIQENTNVPPEYKRNCLLAMSHKWRNWKCRVKELGYDAFDNDDDRKANCPQGVYKEDWPDIIDNWGKEKSQKIAEINKINRSKQGQLHTTGKMPISVLKKQRDDKGEPVDRISMYFATRAKSEDRAVKDMFDNLNEAIEQLPEEDRNCPEKREKIFRDTFGKDSHGRMRLMPRGMTPTVVYGKKTGVSRGESVAKVRSDLEAKMETQRQEMETEFDRRLAAQKEADRLEMAAQKEADRLEMEARLAAQREANRLEMEAFKNELLSQIRRQ